MSGIISLDDATHFFDDRSATTTTIDCSQSRLPSERGATVSVAFTIGRSLACNNETAAAPVEPKTTETVVLRTTPKILHILHLSRPRDLVRLWTLRHLTLGNV